MADALVAVEKPYIVIPPLADGVHIGIVDMHKADSSRMTVKEPLPASVDRTVEAYEKACPEKRLKMVNDMVWSWPLLWLRVRTKLKQRSAARDRVVKKALNRDANQQLDLVAEPMQQIPIEADYFSDVGEDVGEEPLWVD
jgi:hypothetical protein